MIEWVTYTYIPETSSFPPFLPTDNRGVNIETWNGNTYVQLQNAAMLSEMVSDATSGTSNNMKVISFLYVYIT